MAFANQHGKFRLAQNFFNLLNAATKEIVFTCDQDDIWDASKIEVMCEAFANTDVKVLVSDYTELVEPGD